MRPSSLCEEAGTRVGRWPSAPGMISTMDASRRLPDPTPAGLAAARALEGRVAGEVRTTPLSRWLYSTDSSSYRLLPDAVLVAGAVEDLYIAAQVAAEHGVSLCPRGAGTSVAGQAIGTGIVVDCFKLDRILEIDADGRRARVEPGVIQASLNAAAAAYGLEFGPDTSTVDQATIGGMVGNNSSGSRSIIYGQSVDKLLGLRTVLIGGDELDLGVCADDDLSSGVTGPQARAIAAELAAMRRRSRAAIATGYPQTSRCTSGYNLRCLLDRRPNLARLLAGSEGSLALFTMLDVELDPLPETRVGAALTFATIRQALEANVALLSTGPSAVELLDLDPLRRAPNLSTFRLLAPLLANGDPAMLTVEYQGSEEEARAGLARLRTIQGELGVREVVWLEDRAALGAAAALRRAVLPLLMGAPGAERPAAIVEDTAVAPEHLADFVDQFQRIIAAHGAKASFTGHASAGCLHVRPLLDLKSVAGVAKLDAIAREVGQLVCDYHGAVSGEHGCGIARSWILPRLFGAELYAEFVALKKVFDPRNLLGPGHVVDGPSPIENLRFGANYRGAEPWRPRLSYAAEGGFDLAVEKCFGAGICKKISGTMCPPATVSRDEARSTRARANALQALVAGTLALEDITEDEFVEVLGTCLACKACKTECPAGVDMAALKVEWLAERHAREGVPLLARGIANFRRLIGLAAPFAPLIRAVARPPLTTPFLRLLGVAPQRPLPPIARRPLTRRVRADAHPDVLVFADCFVKHQEPEVGEALVRLLRAAGHTVGVVDAGCCGRTMMSTGMLDKARRAAADCLQRLHAEVQAGRTIVFVEPSCLSMIHDDWQRLLPDDPRVDQVAAACRFGLDLVAGAAHVGRLEFRPGGDVLLHPHCHERSLFTSQATEQALRSVPGITLRVLDEGCCGMSGIFGYEAEHYELSVAIAERGLLPAVRAAAPQTAVLATGTSCRAQIGDLSGRRAEHPAVFLADRLLP